MTLPATTIEDDGADRPVDTVQPLAAVEATGDGRVDAAVRDVLRLLEANRALQETLAANAATCERSLLAMLGGADPGHVLDDVDVASSRINLADSLAEFERARHQARRTFIAAQFGGGMNMKEIGRRWAISRQLAHRFFKEARRDG